MNASPPEPRQGDVCSAAQFPGAGFKPGDRLDYAAMNRWAEIYGWSCRFRPSQVLGGAVDIYYPAEADRA